MTREEEAIEEIQKFIGWFKTDSRIYTALNMAIKALSQEPICPSAGVDCEDCPAQEPMREFTEEEAKAYSKALDKMYKPTGFNVFDEPCETCGYVEGSPFCLQYCPYDAERKKEQEPLEIEAAKLQQAYNKGFDDCRQAVLELIADYDLSMGQVVRGVHDLSPVTPKPGKCKDCKWWKDSDGFYRRGGRDDKCPINRREVYEGKGYCYLFEPQESEDKIDVT